MKFDHKISRRRFEESALNFKNQQTMTALSKLDEMFWRETSGAPSILSKHNSLSKIHHERKI